jgi:hypothetical protein
MNRGPSLGVLGTLGKILSDADAIDVEQYLHFYGDYIRLAGRPDRSGLVARVSIDTNQEAVEAFGINRGETHIVGIDVDHKAVVRIHPARRVRVAGNADGEEIILRSSGSQKGLFIDGRCG